MNTLPPAKRGVLRLLFLDKRSLLLLLLAGIYLGLMTYVSSTFIWLDWEKVMDESYTSRIEMLEGIALLSWVLLLLVSLVKIDHVWRLLQHQPEGKATISVADSVRRLFFPIYNWYWMFRVYLCMSSDANRILGAGRIPRWPFICFCVMNTIAAIVSYWRNLSLNNVLAGEDFSELDVEAVYSTTFTIFIASEWATILLYVLVLYTMNRMIVELSAKIRENEQ